MADPKAIQFLEGIYSRVDKQVRDIVSSMLPGVNFAAQDDGSVIANDHRIMNFQGPGVVVTDDPALRRVNVFVPGSPTSSGSSTVASTVGQGKAHTLWNGSSNDPAPAGWYTPSFNDSSWTATTASTGSPLTPIVGTQWVTVATGNRPLGEMVLYRLSFTLAAGSATSGTLQFLGDDWVREIYLNGALIYSNPSGAVNFPTPTTITLSPGQLVLGGSNVLAARIEQGHFGSGTDGFDHLLSFGIAGAGTDTQYIPKSIITTKGDVIVGASSANPVRLGVGTNGYVLTANSAATNGVDWEAGGGGGMSNPMTTQDDIIVGGSSGTPGRLAKGSDSQVLTIDPSSHHLAWATPSGGGGGGFTQRARVSRSSDLTVNSGAFTVVTWSTEDVDTDGMVTLGTNNDRITIQTAGTYLLVANARFSAGSSNEQDLLIYRTRSGSDTLLVQDNRATGQINGMSLTVVDDALVGDYYRVQTWTNTSSPKLQVSSSNPCNFSATRLQ